jgi:hypothetical protein
VINRMLAKDPAQRYASYPELIEHLSYARTKLLERSTQPYKPKERVVVEVQTAKNVSGLLTLALACIIFLGCVLGIFRAEIFGPSVQRSPPVSYSDAQLEQAFRIAVQQLARGRAQQALTELDRLVPLSGNRQPIKNWIRMNSALAALVAGDRHKAAGRFDALVKDGPYSFAENEKRLASFFVAASEQLANQINRSPLRSRRYSNENFEGFGLLCFALHDWAIADAENASEIFTSFLSAKLRPAHFPGRG